MDERACYLGFSLFSGIGPMKFEKLVQTFSSARVAWEAPQKDLEALLGTKLSTRFESFRINFSIADYAKQLKKKNVSFITLADETYPKALSAIKNPPIVLYIKGADNFDYSNNRSVAIVGTRKITEYGRQVTELFTQDLVAHGFTIVSGLAMGVDAVAHKTAIENNGKTIAVLGCGVDCCTPEENQGLYDEILQHDGLIVSELPLGHSPTKGSFPARNRIVAGLSQAVLVTEGAADSGALITADYAFKFNRKVFAVPGPITSSLSKGPYSLIQKGATLVTGAEEIIRELSTRGTTGITSITGRKKITGETKEEQKILKALENEALTFDQLVQKTNILAKDLGSILSIMELKGSIKSTASGGYAAA